MEITETDLQVQANNILDAVEFISITNDNELEEANSILRKIHTLKKAAKAHFDGLKKPFNEAMANLRAKEKEFVGPMEDGEKAIKKLISDYNIKVEEKLKEQQKQLEEMNKQLSENGIAIITNTVGTARPKTDTYMRTRYDFDIVDVNLIPREYLVVDTVAIGKVVRAMKDKTNIPGIKVKVVKDVALRG